MKTRLRYVTLCHVLSCLQQEVKDGVSTFEVNDIFWLK